MEDITNNPRRKYTKDSEDAAKRRAARRQGHEAPKGKLFYSCETKEEIEQIDSMAKSIKNVSWWWKPKYVHK